jgi:lipoprotein NlpD
MNAAGPQARRLPSTCWPPGFLRGRCWTGFCLACVLLLGASEPAWAERSRSKPRATPKGITHTVQSGQTLFQISQAYDVKIATLLEANRLKASTLLKVGQRLVVPGATATKKVETSRPLTKEERGALERSLREELTLPSPHSAPPSPPRPRVKTDAAFVWPIHGPINSPFGPRNGRLHAGVDIGSPHYQEVIAAADAEVLYANDTRGPLGKAIVLQHGRGMRTVYAHLSIIIARERDAVRQGEAIGGVGNTGRATGPHLHFEIRRHGAPRNPEDYLPATIDELVKDLSAPR